MAELEMLDEQTCAGCACWDGAVCLNGESKLYTMETCDGCEKRVGDIVESGGVM